MNELDKILGRTIVCDDPFRPWVETEEEKLRKKILYLETKIQALEAKEVKLPERYIINKEATILFWSNGTKTIVRRCADDEFNPRLAFLTAFFQHYCGMSKNKANKYLANLQVEGAKKETKFKVGDTVEVIVGDAYSEKGWIGKITEVTSQTSIKVKYDNGNEWWIEGDKLKLIKEGK